MMYKLEDGQLIEAPVIYNGIVGYNNNLAKLIEDGWKPLVITGKGDLVKYIEHKDNIEEQHMEPPYDYRALRAQAYPSLGDMIDAFCRAYEGDDTELQTLLAQRQIIKNTIKKVKDAD